MALLDFIRNREGQRPAGEQLSPQQPETAKQMYTRQAGAEQAAAKPSDLVRADQQARLAEAQSLYEKGTQGTPSATPSPTSAPAGAENPQPMQQQGVGQERVAPEMSPTSGLASSRAQDVDGSSAPASIPAKSQQQTIARPAPSWER